MHPSSNMIEMKRSVSKWTSLRTRISPSTWRKKNTFDKNCEGVGDVVGVEALLGGVAQVIFHGVQVVEVGVQVRVHQDRGVEEDGEGKVEVERKVEEISENHTCATWREDDRHVNDLSQEDHDSTSRQETQLTARCCAHLCSSCALWLFVSLLMSSLVLMKFV